MSWRSVPRTCGEFYDTIIQKGKGVIFGPALVFLWCAVLTLAFAGIGKDTSAQTADEQALNGSSLQLNNPNLRGNYRAAYDPMIGHDSGELVVISNNNVISIYKDDRPAQPVKKIYLPFDALNASPRRHIALSPNYSRDRIAYILAPSPMEAEQGEFSIFKVDTGANEIVVTFSVGIEPRKIAVSNDGARLAVLYRNDQSISLFEASTGRNIGSFETQGKVRDLQFFPSFEENFDFATVGEGGLIGYDIEMNPITLVDASALGGTFPLSISISPSGKRIAIGTGEHVAVGEPGAMAATVGAWFVSLSGKVASLTEISAVSTLACPWQWLTQFSWNESSDTLVAGGYFHQNNRIPENIDGLSPCDHTKAFPRQSLVKWELNDLSSPISVPLGRGSFRGKEVGISDGSTIHLLARTNFNRNILFAQGGDWGQYRADGVLERADQVPFANRSDGINWQSLPRNHANNFRVNVDGSVLVASPFNEPEEIITISSSSSHRTFDVLATSIDEVEEGRSSEWSCDIAGSRMDRGSHPDGKIVISQRLIIPKTGEFTRGSCEIKSEDEQASRLLVFSTDAIEIYGPVSDADIEGVISGQAAQPAHRVLTASSVLRGDLSKDGRFFVAGHIDGVLSWWDVEAGLKKVFSLYIGNDPNDWVAWTPEGAFTSSGDGARFIGWGVSSSENGTNDFIEIRSLRSKFRCDSFFIDLLQLSERERSSKLARDCPKLQKASLEPAVQVSILSPDFRSVLTEGMRTIELTGRLSGPIDFEKYEIRFDAFFNHHLALKSERYTSISSDQGFKFDVALPDPLATENDLLLTISASLIPKDGVGEEMRTSARQSITDRRGERAKASLHVFAIGVSNYFDEKFFSLDYPHKDAQDFVSFWLGQQGNELYDRVEVHELFVVPPDETDLSLSHGGTVSTHVNARLTALVNQLLSDDEIHANDTLIFYFSGHGAIDSSQKYSLIGADSKYDASKNVSSFVMPVFEILNSIRNIETVKNKMVFLDACRADDRSMLHRQNDLLRGYSTMIGFLEDDYVDSMDIYLSTRNLAYEHEGFGAEGGGLFTQELVRGLQGAANTIRDDGFVDSDELSHWLSNSWKRLADEKADLHAAITGADTDTPLLPRYEQHPEILLSHDEPRLLSAVDR